MEISSKTKTNTSKAKNTVKPAQKNSRVLLINPSYNVVYGQSKIKAVVPFHPVINLAILGAALLERGHTARIFDFCVSENTLERLEETLKEFRPDIVGFTVVTPMYGEVKRLAELVREILPKALIVGGAAHVSSYPAETVTETEIDVAVVGEGTEPLCQLAEGFPWEEIPSITYRDESGAIKQNPRSKRLATLDDEPMPAYHLYDIQKYRVSSVTARNWPVAYFETTRGCPHLCTYCNKNVFGRTFRTKSIERCLDEIRHFLDLGFKEIHMLDDTFSTNKPRAKELCRAIIRSGLKFPWMEVGGLRVDRVDEELFELMREAGCYGIGFGIESGSQQILDRIRKGTTVEQIRRAVTQCYNAGIEPYGFFMLGLPDETEETMRATIDLAKELPFQLVKFNITIPLPGTELFEEYKERGLLKSLDWEKYSFYTDPEDLYTHPTLEWSVVRQYFKQAYREFYWRPSYILQRLIRDIKMGVLFDDIYYSLKTDW